MRRRSTASRPSPVSSRRSASITALTASRANGSRSADSPSWAPGSVAARSTGETSWPAPPVDDQDEPLGLVRELVGELHRHPAPERVPDERDAIDAEHGEQVAHAVRVRRNRVVGARLVRRAVPEQVRRDHQVLAREQRDDLLPGRESCHRCRGSAAAAVPRRRSGTPAGSRARDGCAGDLGLVRATASRVVRDPQGHASELERTVRPVRRVTTRASAPALYPASRARRTAVASGRSAPARALMPKRSIAPPTGSSAARSSTACIRSAWASSATARGGKLGGRIRRSPARRASCSASAMPAAAPATSAARQRRRGLADRGGEVVLRRRRAARGPAVPARPRTRARRPSAARCSASTR